MKNIGLIGLKYKNVDNFTTNIGIKIRRYINPFLRKILSYSAKHQIIIDHYPDIPKGKAYIFASTHSFAEDVIANLSSIDRNAYILFGTTDQLENNPQAYAAWANGLIYIDRRDSFSRKDSIEKMKRILDSGSSVLLYPEGGWNNTENLLVLPLFAGPYILSRDTEIPVIPIAAFYENGSDSIYLNFGEPLDLFQYEKDEALQLLRDTLATMIWEAIIRHGTRLSRSALSSNLHYDFLETRKQEYMNVKWSKDCWDEELVTYCKKGQELPKEVCTFVEKVSVSSQNASMIAPFLVSYENHQKYDLKRYMRKT